MPSDRQSAVPPPESLVHCDGVPLHVHVEGTRSALPPIVLEAGGGAIGAWWAWVQPPLAARTLTIRYDRAGLGASGATDTVSAAAVGARLDALLDALGIDRPCVFVGHSLGALYALHYAATHPQRAAGLVLVDPTPLDAHLLDGANRRLLPVLIPLLQVLRGLARTGLLRRFHPFAALVAGLPDEARREALAAIADPRHLAGFIRELRAIPAIQAELAALPFPAQLPLRVISAGQRGRRRAPAADAHPSLRHHRETAARAANGRQVVIDAATHGTLLTGREAATALAGQILAFVDTLAP